jgi:signal transduction histidine kinase
MLEGLTQLHPQLFAFSDDERVLWISDALDLALASTERWVGRPIGELFEALHEGPQPAAPLTRLEVEAESGRTLTICIADGAPGPGERPEPQDDLERKNEELENCVQSVAHDLRSPLVAILGFTRLLREDDRNSLDATGLHFLDRIEEAGRNIERLLQDLLELYRIEATPRHRTRVDPRPVLLQVASELKLRLEEKGIALHIPEAPPTLHCDRTRLYQIFSNLIGNAIHHMGDPTEPSIDVTIEACDGGWEIGVADNGRGIAEIDRGRIFDVFQTVRGSGPARRGRGLGLPIVKKIVDLHQGRIAVESDPGRGTRFRIWLPRD